MNNMKNPNWCVAVSYRTELFSEYLLERGYKLDQPKLLKEFGLLTHRMMIDNDIYVDQNQVEAIHKLLKKNPYKSIDKIYNVVELVTKDFLNYSKSLPKDFSRLSNDKLVRLFKVFVSKYQSALSLIGIPTTVDVFLEVEVQDILKKYLNDVRQEYASLAFPAKVVDSIRQSDELKLLIKRFSGAIKFHKKNNDLNLLMIKYPLFYKTVLKHVEKYGWLTTTLFSGKPMTLDFIFNDLQIKENKNTKNNSKVYKLLDKNEKKMVTLLQKAIYFRTARLDWLNQGCFLARPLMQELALRAGVSYNELIYLTPEEIIRGQNKKFTNKSFIKSRIKGYAMALNGKELKIFTGSSLIKIKNKFKKIEEISEIKGLTACQGIVKGVVSLVLSRNDLEKVKNGQVMVCRLTTPDFVVALKKASAIVTDLGGITSHAAIVARELNVPCVVGTKIATQALKDGDLVEVNANNGTVSIIELK